MNPKTPLPAIDTARYVPSLLSVLNNRLSSSASDHYLQHFDVGLNEWRILVVLARTPQVSAKNISEQAVIHLTVISRSLRDMEKKGLVTFEKGKWERLVGLTPEGEDVYRRVLDVAMQREMLLLTDFTDGERDQLCEFLRRMTANTPLVESIKPSTR